VKPALAIAEGIKAREPEAGYLYRVRNRAECVMNKGRYPLRFVSSEGFPGFRISFRLLRFLLKLSIGVIESLVILPVFAPKWVIATGGYVSAPVIAAALILKKLRIAPVGIFLHEQNSIPGQLNALMGNWVDRVLLTFPRPFFIPKNGVVVGYPIRHSIVAIPPMRRAKSSLSMPRPERRDVFGGSRGARHKRAIVDALPTSSLTGPALYMHGMGLAGLGRTSTPPRIQRASNERFRRS